MKLLITTPQAALASANYLQQQTVKEVNHWYELAIDRKDDGTLSIDGGLVISYTFADGRTENYKMGKVGITIPTALVAEFIREIVSI